MPNEPGTIPFSTDEGLSVFGPLLNCLAQVKSNESGSIIARTSNLKLPVPDVTHILSQIESGDPSAAEQLLPLVYDELRKLAAAKLAHEKPGQTLQATALVHEAYIRLVDQTTPQQWDAAATSLPRPPRPCGGS